MELLSRLELPNLILTKDALYQLSYNSRHICYINVLFRCCQSFF